MSKALKKLLRVLEVSVSNKGEAHVLTVGHLRSLTAVAIRNGEPNPALGTPPLKFKLTPATETRRCELGRLGELTLDEVALFVLLDLEYLEDRYEALVFGSGGVYISPDIRRSAAASLSRQLDVAYERLDKAIDRINHRNA